ncbi:DHH family phosphoesterase [Candidatus Falkowbacteria bacterium]|nr:DHH family phosphoesterase [Candidatus Falkowbacteria bacterium]
MGELIFEEARQKILAVNNILLITHKKPDGDACGSMLALLTYLRGQGKDVSAFIADPPPSYFSFLPDYEEIKNDTALLDKKWDTIVFVDTADFKIAGVAEELLRRCPVINIDHHQTNTKYGHINIIDETVSSTCELIYRFFKYINFEIDRNIATCLLSGLLTDTGGLVNAATSFKAMAISSDLLMKGAKINKIAENIFKNKSLDGLKMWCLELSRLKFNKRFNLAYTYIKESDLMEYNIKAEEIDGLANFLNVLSNVSAVLVLKISNHEIEGSLRTTKDNINVSRLANIFGGGGHKKAAGFTISGTIKEVNGKLLAI